MKLGGPFCCSRVGSDLYDAVIGSKNLTISIHAPVWGATNNHFLLGRR
ncbi:hypothetical protein CCDG5_1995 [[Clostridium] cellulosi]|uniref:Uncharacterized protein n=1 Tax=[Clostridium] cellulosi TaxID=29343 RepID=A0A078KRE9_9FIRM|nr:hypothetical protein CCDG5_1995 [[Clostridium] cellulosi]